jgi:putative transposase
MAIRELDSNKHSVFLLFYHLILVVKYRKRVIDGRVSASSRIIKKEFPEIRKQLWKEYFWSRNYCLLTSGGVSVEIIKEYIRRQGNEKSL